MKKIDLVADALAGRIGRGELSPGERMPSLRRMAREWELSYVSMRRVYGILCERKVLAKEDGIRGRYVVAATPGDTPFSPPPPPLAGGSRAEAIARVLEDEILGGLYLPDNRLPSVKELCARFGCGTPAGRRALGLLESRGVARRRGRRLSAGAGVAVSRSRVWLLTTPESFASYRDHIQSFFTAIERARIRLRWEPTRTLRSCDADTLRTVNPLEVAGLIRAAGARVDPDQWRRLVRAMPGATLVDVDLGGATLAAAEDRRPHYRIASDHRAAAVAVAFLLKELGHRHIAFISHLSPRAYPWLEQRLGGLRRCYPAVRPGERPSCSLVRLPRQSISPVLRRLYHTLSNHLRLASSIPTELVKEYLNGLPYLFHYERSARDRLVLDGLSREPRITAWVCVNDDIASMVLHHLEQRGWKVPEEVSVVGFDNRHIAARMDLTTYDFGFDKMGHLAMNCLAGRVRSLNRGVTRVSVDGDVVVRASAGPPRRTPPRH
jgi:DNA-binding LacI/PurR family transcriptional regulator